jgi:hypothetical protein
VTSQSKAVASLLPREMACIQSGLCLYHFNRGKKAHSPPPQLGKLACRIPQQAGTHLGPVFL